MAAITATVQFLSSGAARPAGGLLAAFRHLAHDLMNPYHPERHYMRGPGPAWRRKHGAA
jgi:hypothetical protein